MKTLLAVLGVWFSLSLPVGLFVGRMLALSSTAE